MRPHATHYDDCGCLSERFMNRISELEREVAKWKWVAEHMVSIGPHGSTPAVINERFIEYPEDIDLLLARYAEEASDGD